MNKTLAAVLILSALPLVGCGMTEITPADVALEEARTRARTACVEARARAEEARMQAIGNMPENVQGMAMMGESMARQSEALSGKDPCGQGAGVYDAKIAEVKEKNATVREGMGAVKSGSIALYGIDRFSAVAEKGIKSAGDRVSQTATEGSTVSYTQERVSSDSTITTKNAGDGAATSAAPVVSGPDKSTSTTIEAPPEPELPEGEFTPTEPPAHFDDLPIDIPEIPTEAAR